MLADVIVWLARPSRALAGYHDGNKSLWSAAESQDRTAIMLEIVGSAALLKVVPEQHELFRPQPSHA